MSSDRFRVRFAPSPTGSLHVGNARTAVLNWLLARRHGGEFILRIEDTDTGRSTSESETAIIEDLRWLGLDWDEGPLKGGPHEPYRQSERGGLYRRLAEELVEAGLAYHCHATDEQLERFRGQARAGGRSTVYRGELSGPGEGESGQPSVRFRVPGGQSRWTDLVKGEVSIGHDNIGDFVILRSDGRPTYNFAVVADDLDMRVSHVVRGDDHLSNTPRQLMLYRALGEKAPGFAHIPMILGPDGQRLSKRHGATSVAEFREQGYLPGALINYLSLLSWSSESGDELLSPGRLKQEVDFDRLGRSAAVFDTGKLRWLNGKYIRELEDGRLTELARHYGGPEAGRFDESRLRAVALALRDKIEVLSELPGMLGAFSGREPSLEDPEDREVLGSEDARRALAAVAAELRAGEPESAEEMMEAVRAGGKAAGVKGRMLYMPLRLALTGDRHGPEIPRIMAVVGARRCAELLESAAELA